MSGGYIYILREREFIRMKDSIWKIGATKHDDIFKRVNQYPNNSQLMYCLRVTNAFHVEKEIMSCLKTHPGIKQRTDIGREYFEGNLQKILSLVLSISVEYLEDIFTECMHKLQESEDILTECTQELIKENGSRNSIKQLLSERFVITDNHDDYVPFNDIFQFICKDKKQEISKTKLGRELNSLNLVKDDKWIKGGTISIRRNICYSDRI
jgi:hypothetical protein